MDEDPQLFLWKLYFQSSINPPHSREKQKWRFWFRSSFFSFFFLSFFFSLMLNSRSIRRNEWSAHQTTALQSEIFLFFVRAECELKSMSYGPKHVLCMVAFLHAILCIITCTCATRKLKVVWGHFTCRTIALLSKLSILRVTTVCKIWSASYGSKTHITTSFWHNILCILTHGNSKSTGRCKHPTCS